MRRAPHRLPAYYRMQASYHLAFATELRAMMAQLPISAGDHVLDVCCGDGTYTDWFLPFVSPNGRVTAVDNASSYLALARRRVAKHPRKSIKVVKGSIQRLPFKNNSFDVVWCAQSLFSLPDPLQALKEMARVVRRGGIVAVLEDDTLHQLLIPWPVKLELALRKAEWDAFERESNDARKYYVARGLRALFCKAGLRPQKKRTYAFQRALPLTPPEQTYIAEYLKDLVQRTAPYLSSSDAEMASRFLSPRSPEYLPRQAHFSMTCLDHVMWGKKPS